MRVYPLSKGIFTDGSGINVMASGNVTHNSTLPEWWEYVDENSLSVRNSMDTRQYFIGIIKTNVYL